MHISYYYLNKQILQEESNSLFSIEYTNVVDILLTNILLMQNNTYIKNLLKCKTKPHLMFCNTCL